MSSFRRIAPPDTIPEGTSPQIAEAIRRNRLEYQQHLALERIANEIGLPASRLKRHRKRKTAKYTLKTARRLRISEAPEAFTRAEIILRDKAICHICRKTCEPNDIHIDHDLPLSRGGAHTRANVHVACAECNLRKGNMTTAEYRATLGLHSPVATRTNE